MILKIKIFTEKKGRLVFDIHEIFISDAREIFSTKINVQTVLVALI